MGEIWKISKIRALQLFQYLKDNNYDYKKAAEKYQVTTLEIFKLVEKWENELVINKDNKPIDITSAEKATALERANNVLMNEYNEDTTNKDLAISKIENVKLETIEKLRELIKTSKSLHNVTYTLKVLHEITLETKLYERDNGEINNDNTDKFIQNIEKQLILNVNE